MTNKIKLGISSCLLGEKVRYDGGHKYDSFLIDTLREHVEFIPVCPEVECGLGVPREPMYLAGDPNNPQLLIENSSLDLTDQLTQWARERLLSLGAEKLSGFIFKARSPSCGLREVKVQDDQGEWKAVGTGIFAKFFREYFPEIPVEDEDHLQEAEIRKEFFERIFNRSYL